MALIYHNDPDPGKCPLLGKLQQLLYELMYVRYIPGDCKYPPMHTEIPYSQKFSVDKNFTLPTYPCITGIFSGINFCPYIKITIGSM